MSESDARLSLSEKIILIEGALVQAALPHAFGGALALAYYGTPRATIDIDVNLFVPVSRAEDVLRVFDSLGAEPLSGSARGTLARDEQVRLFWRRTPIDLFFAYDPFHDVCLERRRLVPFGPDASIHVLAAEDLVIYKTIFDRAKDWVDIGEVLFSAGDELDLDHIRDWLARILGHDDARAHKLNEQLAAHRP